MKRFSPDLHSFVKCLDAVLKVSFILFLLPEIYLNFVFVWEVYRIRHQTFLVSTSCLTIRVGFEKSAGKYSLCVIKVFFFICQNLSWILYSSEECPYFYQNFSSLYVLPQTSCRIFILLGSVQILSSKFTFFIYLLSEFS